MMDNRLYIGCKVVCRPVEDAGSLIARLPSICHGVLRGYNKGNPYYKYSVALDELSGSLRGFNAIELELNEPKVKYLVFDKKLWEIPTRENCFDDLMLFIGKLPHEEWCNLTIVRITQASMENPDLDPLVAVFHVEKKYTVPIPKIV